jgi:hypothetical protein
MLTIEAKQERIERIWIVMNYSKVYRNGKNKIIHMVDPCGSF